MGLLTLVHRDLSGDWSAGVGMLARQVPIDGVGMQLHLQSSFDNFAGHSLCMRRDPNKATKEKQIDYV